MLLGAKNFGFFTRIAGIDWLSNLAVFCLLNWQLQKTSARRWRFFCQKQKSSDGGRQIAES
jgi:hypothetical protein